VSPSPFCSVFSLLLILAFNCHLEAADQERREQGGGGRGSEGAGQIPVYDREGEAGIQHGRE
jgi:hypothetical protein